MTDQQVVKIQGADLVSSVLQESAIQDFEASQQGALLRPGEAGYDEARRVWNGMIDRRPALIACCHGVADVMNSVNFAPRMRKPRRLRPPERHSTGPTGWSLRRESARLS